MTDAGDDGWLIYSGRLNLSDDDGTVYPGEAKIAFVWRPTPCVRVRFGLDKDFDTAKAFAFLDGTDREVIPPEPADLTDPVESPVGDDLELDGEFRATSSFTPRRFALGSGDQIAQLRYAVINFDPVRLQHRPSGGDTESWVIGDWRVSLIANGTTSVTDRLNANGGYAATHWITVEREDNQPFNVEDTKLLGEGLFLLLSFMKGALVGLGLPTGLNAAGEVVYVQAGTTVVSSWRTQQTWFDYGEIGVLGDLLSAWLGKASDDFWRRVISRAIRIAVSANNPNPLDVAIPTGFTALELLAWAVLVVDDDWVRPSDGDVNASGMIRLLLRWAGIPTELPPELGDLRSYAGGNADLDGPTAIAYTRNRLVHPPRKSTQPFPEWRVMMDAYRLELEYVDLLILRLLDHRGMYGHRRHVDGRWIGDTIPVPWAKAAP